MHKNNTFVTIFILTCTLVFFVSCAISPPVQEMSNARQALNAAREAHAEQYANTQYKKAKQLLEEARSNIVNGDYYTARYLALEAKNEAIQARQNSQNHIKESK